jgi:hypothetical protein
LKRWFSLETKGIRGQRIDWLVWKLTISAAKHHMHMIEMKKCKFIKNKVVEHIVKMNIEKATLLFHTHVTHGIDDLNKTGHTWKVQNQQHQNMTYKVTFLFTKYVCSRCEWVLHGNLCKHQVVLLTCTDIIKENIIQYCGTWYGSNHGHFVAMFVGPTYLHIYDNESDDEEANEYHFEEPWVVDMCRLMTLDNTSLNVKKKKDHNQPSSSSTPTKKSFV